MGRILEPIEAKILLKCAEARKAAVQQAAKEVQKDVKKKVFDQAVSDYYADYSPTKYKRTESLYRAFRVTESNDGKSFEIDGKWDFNWLPQHESGSKFHKSGEEDWLSRYNKDFDWDSDDNGMPQKGWIFQNFMEGVHPRFYTDRTLGIVIDDSTQFTPSWRRIKQYKDKYFKGDDMKIILLKNLKKQYKKL